MFWWEVCLQTDQIALRDVAITDLETGGQSVLYDLLDSLSNDMNINAKIFTDFFH